MYSGDGEFHHERGSSRRTCCTRRNGMCASIYRARMPNRASKVWRGRSVAKGTTSRRALCSCLLRQTRRTQAIIMLRRTRCRSLGACKRLGRASRRHLETRFGRGTSEASRRRNSSHRRKADTRQRMNAGIFSGSSNCQGEQTAPIRACIERFFL